MWLFVWVVCLFGLLFVVWIFGFVNSYLFFLGDVLFGLLGFVCLF